jgi:hypothetical protein
MALIFMGAPVSALRERMLAEEFDGFAWLRRTMERGTATLREMR